MRDGTRRSQISAVLGENRSHISRCAVAIVGQRLNDQGYACGAKAFIADFFIIISATNRCLVDCALYVVLGHGLRLGGVDREAQTRVHVRIDRKSTRLNSRHECASRMPSLYGKNKIITN